MQQAVQVFHIRVQLNRNVTQVVDFCFFSPTLPHITMTLTYLQEWFPSITKKFLLLLLIT